jgi:hypothetical protein
MCNTDWRYLHYNPNILLQTNNLTLFFHLWSEKHSNYRGRYNLQFREKNYLNKRKNVYNVQRLSKIMKVLIFFDKYVMKYLQLQMYNSSLNFSFAKISLLFCQRSVYLASIPSNNKFLRKWLILQITLDWMSKINCPQINILIFMTNYFTFNATFHTLYSSNIYR